MLYRDAHQPYVRCAVNVLCFSGREFFKKVDENGDNKITVEDVKKVMRQRKLPESYATQFISAARGGRWWSNSIRSV